MNAFWGFVRKEVLHLLRDRQTLTILLLMPLVQVLLFGYAIRTDVRSIPVVIVDPAPGPASRALVNRLRASDRFALHSVEFTDARLDEWFRDGIVRQAILLPADLERRLVRHERVPIELATDASDPNTGSVMEAYATALVTRWFVERSGSGPMSPLELVPRMRYNPTLESVNLFVPGLIAFVLTIVSALMTAISITREKEMGTMEMLLVSPLHPVQIVIGKVVPYVFLGMCNVLLVLAAARLVFAVPFRGSPGLLLAVSLVYVLASLGVGILISTVAATQRTAQMAALAGLLLPTMLLSGFIFPIESMPAPLQVISHVVPARWFLVVVRGIMTKGAGLAQLWQEVVILAGMALVVMTVSIRRLAVRLE